MSEGLEYKHQTDVWYQHSKQLMREIAKTGPFPRPGSDDHNKFTMALLYSAAAYHNLAVMEDELLETAEKMRSEAEQFSLEEILVQAIRKRLLGEHFGELREALLYGKTKSGEDPTYENCRTALSVARRVLKSYILVEAYMEQKAQKGEDMGSAPTVNMWAPNEF